MFDIYIKDFNQNGQLVTTETLVQSIPSATQGELKLISPTVKAEMGNAEQFNFSIEGGTKFYDAFNQMKTFMRVVYDGDTIFYGRVLTIENGFTGNRKLRLEGPLAFLNDTSIEGQKEEGRPNISVNAYLSKIIDNHNTMCGDSKRSFNLGEVPGNYHSASSEQQIQNAERKFGQDGWTDSKGAIEDLRSHYGGYLRVRCNGHKNSDGTYSDDGHYLDWLNHYFNTSENSQAIEVGKNVIDISTSTEIDNIFTVVIPIGNSKSTSYETADGEKKASGPKHFYVDGVEVTVPSICPVYGNALNSGYHTYDDYAQALNRYGRIVKTVTFDDAETPAELLTKCHEWIKNNYQGEVTKFTVKAVDMHQIGDTSISKIMVGDRVRIIYPIVKEDGSVEKAQLVRTCLSINYDLYNPENNSYTFGIPANILTKSYGVTKQGKSTKDASTTPKSGSSTGSTKTVDWLDQVTDWLAHHKAYYKHKSTAYGSEARVIDTDVYPSKFGYKEEYRSYMKGPNGNHTDYIYDIETVAGVGRFTVLKCIPVGTASDFSEEVLRDQLKRVEDSMKGAPSTAIEQAKIATEKNYRNSCTYETYKLQQTTLNGILTHAIIDECHIIPYVKMEYGIDLTNFNNTKMPPLTYTDSDGVTKTIEGSDGQVITKEMFNKDYQGEDLPDGWHLVLNKEGKEIGSCKNADGEWEYWMRDDEGNIVQTSIRKLEWLEADGVKFRGSLIQGDWTDEDGNPHVYKFGQEIENWADGEMVVAHVDGDVIRVGNRTTKYATTAATRINGNWLSPIEYVVDTTTGQKSAILVGTTGQASYEAYYDKKLGCYVPVPFDYYERWTEAEKAAWLAENGPLTTMSGDGIWDTKTLALKGGIQTVIEKDQYGRDIPVSYLLSERTVVGNKNTNLTVMKALLDSGVITQDEYNNPASQALVSQTIYVEDMNGVNAHFHTIETDYLKTANLKASIGDLDELLVKRIVGSGTTQDSYFKSYYGYNYIYRQSLGGSVTSDINMLSGDKYLIYDLKIVPPTGNSNTYTLQKQSIVHNAAWENVGTFSRAISAFSGSWSGNILYVTASPQNQTWAREIRVKTYEWSGTNRVIKYTTWMVPGYGSETQYEDSTECTFSTTISISSLISKITADTVAGTSSEDPERTTFTAKAVNSPGTTLASSTFTLSRTTRRVGSSTNKAVVLKEDATGAVVARIDAQTFYTDGYSAGNTAGIATGKNSVTLNDPTWSAWTSSGYPTSRTVSVTTSGRPTPLTKSVGIYLTGGSSFSSNKTTVYMRTVSESGTIYAAREVDASSVYTDGYNAGAASAVASHTITGFDTNTISGDSLTIGAREYSNNQWGYVISNSATSSVTVLAIVTSTWTCDGVSKSAKSYLQRATTNIYKEGWNNCISKAITLGSVTSGGQKYYLLPDAMTKTNV